MYSDINDIFAIDVLSDEHLEAFSDFLEHRGTPQNFPFDPHGSGRYREGSGEHGQQRYRNFKDTVTALRKQGYKDKEIAKMLNLASSTEVIRKYSIANMEVKAALRARCIRLKEHGLNNSEIGRKLGINESSVRGYLDEVKAERSNKTKIVADILKDEIKNSPYGIVDVGRGVSNRLGVSNDRLKTAIQMLVDNGDCNTFNDISIKQVSSGEQTIVRIIADSKLTKKEIKDLIKTKENVIAVPQHYNEGGEIKKLEPPVSIDSDRILVRYAEEGGSEKDGLIELRRGVEDLSLKDAHYAQVRIAVDGTHYLKGMAMYGDFSDIPDKYDIIFNTNKHKGVPKIDTIGYGKEVFKKMKDSSENLDGNPFGASIKLDDELVLAQRHYIGKDGKEHLSALNIVTEEGNWETWSKNLASQFLSKQPKPLAEKQLNYTYLDKVKEYEDIMNLTNPVVRRKLLEEFADNCDSAAVHLKAAGLPRQQTHVLLPFPEMKDTEIYAPNFENGEKVILIRYPHAGKFELPELTVNNKVKSVKDSLGNVRDAVAINSKVAQILSGADFDGDTVVVIPNNNGVIKTMAPLEGLKDFEPQEKYPKYDGMKVMTKRQKGIEMGKISNLITDMTLKGATADELARAEKHAMVVIDAEKHKLNWRQSEKDNGIRALKEKYQSRDDGKFGGAATLISRSKAEYRIPDRAIQYSLWEYKDKNGKTVLSGSKPDEDGITNLKKIVDKGIYVETGEKAYKLTGKKKYKLKDGKWVEDGLKTIKSTRMKEAKDARELLSSPSSPEAMEVVYADYANRMKALANNARKAYISTELQKQNKSAKETYADAISTLSIKLNNAQKNAPLERNAQALAQVLIKAAFDNNPDLDDDDKKKIRNEKLRVARSRVGANKETINITDYEWKAIQAGAISDNKLKQILDNSDMDRVRELATPKHDKGLSATEKELIKSMLASGYTRGEAAKRVGVSTSTISKYLD